MEETDTKLWLLMVWSYFLFFKSSWWTLGNSLLDQNLIALSLFSTARIRGKQKKPSKLARNIEGTVYAKPNTGIFIGSIFPNWKNYFPGWYFYLFFLKTFPRKFPRSVPEKLKFLLATFETEEWNKLSLVSTWGKFLSLKIDLLYWH